MKKRALFGILIIIFSFFSMNFTRLYADSVISVTPTGRLLSSFSTPYIPPEKIDNSMPYEDIYEMNDNYSESVNLCPENYYNLSLYRTKLQATLDKVGTINDFDFYHFKVLSDSAIVITIQSSNSGLYDFALMTNDYYNISSNNAYHTLENIYYDDSTSNYKCYSGFISPGSYFVFLRGTQNNNITIEYELNLYYELDEVYRNESIVSLKNKGLKGAIWVSDFIPADSSNMFNITDTIKYYDSLNTNLQYPDYALNDISLISEEGFAPLAIYYIWDPLVRFDLYNIFDSIRDEIHVEMIDDAMVAAELEIQRSNIVNCIEIVGTIVSIASGTIIKQKIVQKVLGVGLTFSDIGIDLINNYFNSIMPKFEIEKTEYLAFLSSMCAALEIPVEEGETREDIANKNINEVVRIPIIYTSFMENGNRYFTFKYTPRDFFLYYDHFLYSNSTIYAIQNNLWRGKIYALENLEDFGNIFSLTKTSDLHEHNYNSNYTWMNTTSHRAYCSCGDVVVQGHVVKSGQTICLLCKGKAEIGFIGPMNKVLKKTANGSVILSNGIIVLVEDDLEEFYNNTLIFLDDDVDIS